MIVIGVVFGQAFFAWSYRRVEAAEAPLLALEVVDSSIKSAAPSSALLIIGALGPAVNFLIPLYIQIVQGRTSLQTSVARHSVHAGDLRRRGPDRAPVRPADAAPDRRALASSLVAVGLTMLAFTIQQRVGHAGA